MSGISQTQEGSYTWCIRESKVKLMGAGNRMGLARNGRLWDEVREMGRCPSRYADFHLQAEQVFII